MQILYLNPDIQIQTNRPNSLINPNPRMKNLETTKPPNPRPPSPLPFERYSKIRGRLVKSVERTLIYRTVNVASDERATEIEKN